MTFVAQQLTTGPVLESIRGISGFILDYAVTLAALGALTVALIEAWKKLRDSQAIFHRRSVLRWLNNDPGRETRWVKSAHYEADAVPDRGLGPYDSGRCFEQLLELTTGLRRAGKGEHSRYDTSRKRQWYRYGRSVGFALFELELDRLMGQVQDAADIALNNPTMFPDLFGFLTRGAAADDVRDWLTDVKLNLASLAVDDPENAEKRKAIADRYTRLKQLVRRHLDSFQVVTAMRWREWNQLAAFVVGAILLAAAQFGANYGADAQPSAVQIVLVSLLGGMLAPVAKDLVDALSKVKAGG